MVDGNPIPYLNNLRDRKSQVATYPPGRIPRPKGKREFAAFVAQNGGSTPKIFATVAGGIATDSESGVGAPIGAYLRALPSGKYFCKQNMGSNGTGAITLDVGPGGIAVKGAVSDLALAEQVLGSRDYLVQQSLLPLQHPEVARFHSGTVNTLRMVTFDMESGAAAVAVSLRIGIGAALIDNWTPGGVVIPIDMETAELRTLGVLKKGLETLDAHPDSHIAFRGQKVPFLSEAIALACRLQSKLAIKSIGWDIALLEDGPCILEGNRLWDVYVSAQFNFAFAQSFIRFHIPQSQDTVLRIDCTGTFEDRNLTRQWICAVTGTALASGRVDHLSPERLVMTVAGLRNHVEVVMANIKQSAPRFRIRSMHASRSTDVLRPGLDVDATFLGESLPL